MKWLKAFIARLVAEAVAELHLEQVKAELEQAVSEAAKIERGNLCSLSHTLDTEAKRNYAEHSATEFAELEKRVDAMVEAKLKEFELKLRPIFEAADKEPPTHWKAEAADVKEEHKLRHHVVRR